MARGLAAGARTTCTAPAPPCRRWSPPGSTATTRRSGMPLRGSSACRTKTAAGLAAVAVAAATVFGIGPQNPAVTSVGLSAACELGLGECLQTGLDSMPLVIRDGAVQRQPVIRLVLWGDDRAQEQAAEAEERRAGALAQPLLRDSYGVEPAIPGGVWRMPSTPQDWVRAHHEPALTASDVQAVVRRDRKSVV